jgi:hypothetical protein
MKKGEGAVPVSPGVNAWARETLQMAKVLPFCRNYSIYLAMFSAGRPFDATTYRRTRM